MQVAVVITTVGKKEDAERLAHPLVEERLAACVQLFAIESVYRWEGIQQEPEWRLEIKTSEARVAAVMARLAELHPYDEPEILAFGATSASPGYASWVRSETA